MNKALSIQAHPNKAHAEQLHQASPAIYKDPNHKPEMTLALTNFEAMVGFQSYEKITEHIRKTPELSTLLGTSSESIETLTEQSLKELFTTLMCVSPDDVEKQLDALSSRLTQKHGASVEETLADQCDQLSAIETADKLAKRLISQYPGDVGVFCVYFLNYRCLRPGEAVFLRANEPHAYLQGDCAEIMARSDNVVRAGLTPKLRDVGTLCEMLNYNPFQADENVLVKQVNQYSTRYAPADDAVDEFELERTEIPVRENCSLDVCSFGSIILFLGGKGELSLSTGEALKAEKGTVFFQAAESHCSIKNTSTNATLFFLRASTKGSIGNGY